MECLELSTNIVMRYFWVKTNGNIILNNVKVNLFPPQMWHPKRKTI